MKSINVPVHECPTNCDKCLNVYSPFVETMGKRMVFTDQELQDIKTSKMIHDLTVCCNKGLIRLM